MLEFDFIACELKNGVITTICSVPYKYETEPTPETLRSDARYWVFCDWINTKGANIVIITEYGTNNVITTCETRYN